MLRYFPSSWFQSRSLSSYPRYWSTWAWCFRSCHWLWWCPLSRTALGWRALRFRTGQEPAPSWFFMWRFTSQGWTLRTVFSWWVTFCRIFSTFRTPSCTRWWSHWCSWCWTWSGWCWAKPASWGQSWSVPSQSRWCNSRFWAVMSRAWFTVFPAGCLTFIFRGVRFLTPGSCSFPQRSDRFWSCVQFTPGFTWARSACRWSPCAGSRRSWHNGRVSPWSWACVTSAFPPAR